MSPSTEGDSPWRDLQDSSCCQETTAAAAGAAMPAISSRSSPLSLQPRLGGHRGNVCSSCPPRYPSVLLPPSAQDCPAPAPDHTSSSRFFRIHPAKGSDWGQLVRVALSRGKILLLPRDKTTVDMSAAEQQLGPAAPCPELLPERSGVAWVAPTQEQGWRTGLGTRTAPASVRRALLLLTVCWGRPRTAPLDPAGAHGLLRPQQALSAVPASGRAAGTRGKPGAALQQLLELRSVLSAHEGLIQPCSRLTAAVGSAGLAQRCYPGA